MMALGWGLELFTHTVKCTFQGLLCGLCWLLLALRFGHLFNGDSPVTASVQLLHQFFPAWRMAWQGLGKGKGVLDGCSVEGPEIELLKQTQTQTAAFRDSEKLQTLLSL